jgi:hypothetical protein
MFGRKKEPRASLAETMTNAVMRGAMEASQHNPLVAEMQTQINTALQNANAPVLPTTCPNCGAAVDANAYAGDPDPRCKFCQQPLPVQHRGFQPMAVVGAISSDARQAAIRGTADFTRVLEAGVPCRAMVMNVMPMPGQVDRQGQPITLFVLQATMEGVAPWVVQVGLNVPPEAARVAVRGANLPAKVIPGDEAVVAIDWQAALRDQ